VAVTVVKSKVGWVLLRATDGATLSRRLKWVKHPQGVLEGFVHKLSTIRRHKDFLGLKNYQVLLIKARYDPKSDSTEPLSNSLPLMF
jgi:hypothetical protein